MNAKGYKARVFQIEGITLKQGLTPSIANLRSEISGCSFDITNYDVIIFEEIYFNDFNILQKLYDFMLNNNDKIFLANGDPEQLECCREIITLNKKIEYINIMFPNFIDLKIIKRCDAEQLYKIKEFLENNKDKLYDNEIIKYIIKKYFINKLIKDTSDIEIGLSYTNETKSVFN